MDSARAETLVASFSEQCVAVVGDLMLDRYIWGAATRISQEAPVPVVQVRRSTAAPGGAGNVLGNLAALGARAVAVGAVGGDAAGETLRELLTEQGVSVRGLVTTPDRRTCEKTRVIAGAQQVVRVDTEDTAPLESPWRERLEQTLEEVIAEEQVSAIIVEDYAKGAVSAELLRGVIALGAAHGVPVALDPHSANAHETPGLQIMTPNRSEAFALAGVYEPSPGEAPAADPALARAAARLLERWGVEELLITLGPGGMLLFRQGHGPPRHIPTRAREVFDVSGAGDTAIAAYVLARAAGATPEESAEMANHAAGVVVGKIGTAPVYHAELLRSFQEAPQP